MLAKHFLVLLLITSIAFEASSDEAVTPEGLEYCSVCHGAQLMGNENIQAPRLSGLPAWYVERQLLNFKNRTRGAHPENITGGEMMLMVGGLSDQEIKKIASWVTTTTSPKPTATIDADEKAGEALYQSCAACHGKSGQGNETLGAPKLTGLNDWYIANQLNHFRLGLRGSEASDLYGQQMKLSASVITSEQDAVNLAAYIQQLK